MQLGSNTDPFLGVIEANGIPRLELGTWQGAPGVLLADSNNARRALFELTDDGEPVLRFFNRNGGVSWTAPGR